MSKQKVELDLSCNAGGRQWFLFSYSYETGDGRFSGYLYALSAEHASYLLGELKATAVLDGQVLEHGSF